MRGYLKELYRMKGSIDQDSVAKLASILTSESLVVCLDEFQVTDIVDAMILTRLLKEMFTYPFVLVATSNRAPERLYENGLQRASFLPCIHLLEKHCDVCFLSSGVDYRLDRNGFGSKYFFPASDSTVVDKYDNCFKKVVGDRPKTVETLNIFGRKWEIPDAYDGMAILEFSEHRSAADYLELSEKFKVIFISNLPKMSTLKRDVTKRLIMLIDTLYEKKIDTFILAECSLEEIFDIGKEEETLAWKRCVSRLKEMGSENWC